MTPVLSIDSMAGGAREDRGGGDGREAGGAGRGKKKKDSDRTEVTTLHFLLVSKS